MLLRRTAWATRSTCAVAGYARCSIFSADRKISSSTSPPPLSLCGCHWLSVLPSSQVTPSPAAACLYTQRRHTATLTTADSSASDAVPMDLVRRVTGNKQEMLRLLRLAAGHAAVPVAEMEEVLGKHLGFKTKVAPGPGVHLPSTASALWRTAVWQTLRLHCYFTWITVDGRGGEGKTKGSVRGVVPFDWASVLDRVAAHIPYEGWSEPELDAWLRGSWPILARYTPVWSKEYSGVDSFAQLVHTNFTHIVTLTRSAVTGAVLYHRTGYNSVSVTWRALPDAAATPQLPSGALDDFRPCAAVQHALHILGRGHQLPVWTDVDEVAPLLLNKLGLADGRPCTWEQAFAKDPELSGVFHLESYVRVRAIEGQQRRLAIVDCTSLSPTELNTLLLQHPMRGSGVTIKLLIRAGVAPASYEAYVRTCTEVAGPSILVEEVLVDALLGPEHVLVALLETMETGGTHNGAGTVAAPQISADSSVEDGDCPLSDEASAPMCSTQMAVVLFCGNAFRGVFAAALEEARSSRVALTVFTPE